MINMQDADHYSDQCWQKVYDYRDGIENGSIIVNEYMKSVVRWFRKDDPEYEIKRPKVDKVFRFLSLINIAYDEKG